MSQRDNGVAAAKALGLDVVADKDTYENDTRDFTPVLTPIVKLKPDLLVLSGVAPANAPLLIRSARELGYKGLISTETAQDAKVLEEGAGDLANGFISVGGASTPEIRSKTMEEFIDRYTKKFGEYNDELNTKVYALQYIVDTLKADPKAIDNVDEFKKTIDTFSAPNPYLKDPTPRSCTMSARRRSARSGSSLCRWSSTSTRTASSRRCSSPTSTELLPRLACGERAGVKGSEPERLGGSRRPVIRRFAPPSPRRRRDGTGKCRRAWNRSSPTGSTSARNTR